MGVIHSIVYQPVQSTITRETFTRVPADSVKLVAGHGIDGDRKAGKSAIRHLNIMMRETLDHLATCGYQTDAGQMGEQFQISGLDIENLPAGTLLKLGETAVIRLNELRTGCNKLERVQGQRCAETVGKLGMMASVIESGTVNVGDTIDIITIPEDEANTLTV